jgi:acetate kinase
MLAALGGADALIFIGADPTMIMPLVRNLCDSLAFLGVRCQRETADAPGPHQISTADSAVKVFVSGYDPWEMMSEEAREVMDNSEALPR